MGDLDDAGLQAILGPNADEAIRILESRDDIGIMFMNVNLPGSMDGLRLACCCSHQVVDPAIVVSGHIAESGAGESRAFSRETLRCGGIAKLREFAA